MSAHPKEVRKARNFLRQHARSSAADLSPRKFANAAKEQNSSFSELLDFIGRMYAGGQDQSGDRRELLHKIAANGGD